MKDLADALQLEGPDEFPRGFYEHLAAQQPIPTVVSPEAAALDQAYQGAKRLGPMPVPHVDHDPAVVAWELIMKGLR